MTATAIANRHPVQSQGLLSRCLSLLVQVLFRLLLALVFSILLEWLGMIFGWPEEGLNHSRRLLTRELGYLQADFHQSLLTTDPLDYVERFAEAFHNGLFEATGVIALSQWLSKPAHANDPGFLNALREGYQWVADFIAAAFVISQVFAVRLAVLTLAMPAFVLFSVVALVDGLVRRDLRRWGGGRESAFVYHQAKRALFPALALPWIIYLGLPVSLHPNGVILPFATLFALSLTVTAATFKKYL
jgi:integrating conjugative element membrane protein (TIGR03747 family)